MRELILKVYGDMFALYINISTWIDGCPCFCFLNHSFAILILVTICAHMYIVVYTRLHLSRSSFMVHLIIQLQEETSFSSHLKMSIIARGKRVATASVAIEAL